jgi:hypothetical protein
MGFEERRTRLPAGLYFYNEGKVIMYTSNDIAIARLDDYAPEELYRMLPDQKQNDIWQDFVMNHLDPADADELLLAMLNNTITPDKRKRLQVAWENHLDNLDIRNRYASDLEDRVSAA